LFYRAAFAPAEDNRGEALPVRTPGKPYVFYPEERRAAASRLAARVKSGKVVYRRSVRKPCLRGFRQCIPLGGAEEFRRLKQRKRKNRRLQIKDEGISENSGHPEPHRKPTPCHAKIMTEIKMKVKSRGG